MLKLLIDSKIPYMRGFAERLGEVRYLSGNEITADDVRDVDALIIRTRTRCDRNLLEGSRVRFIATATIGFDHLDTTYLAEAGIAWTNCPGCNADSVAQYVECALLLLSAHGWDGAVPTPPASLPSLGTATDAATRQQPDRTLFQGLTLGIVGVGNVGKRVEAMAQRLGFGRILRCDPPRAEKEGTSGFVSLKEIAAEADVITFHTPLTQAPAAHPTFHLADAAFFQSLSRCPIVLNSARGEVVDTEALKKALATHKVRAAVIDTWENEPQIDRELLNQVFLGTPHIAGYSADGKANGTRMALQAVAKFFGLDSSFCSEIQAPTLPQGFAYYPEGEGHRLAPELRLYDPTRDYEALRSNPTQFESLRGNYPLRREKE